MNERIVQKTNDMRESIVSRNDTKVMRDNKLRKSLIQRLQKDVQKSVQIVTLELKNSPLKIPQTNAPKVPKAGK